MTLHFNLKGMFLLTFGLVLWQFVLPYLWLVGAVGLGAYLFFLHKKGSVSAADGIFAAGFLMNLWYVCASWGNVRQYDYFNFVMGADYFIRNGFFLASPMSFFQEVYFQPPLWGLICALVAKMGMLLGAAQEEGFDAVRLISLFCVSGAGIIFWRLMTVFNFKDMVRLGLLALFCFFPANSIVANLVNNDAMVYFLMLAAIYVGYDWYVGGSWRQALILGGLLVAAGMVKFSGLMVVPALGVWGLCRLFKAENKCSPRLWGQFGVIGLGALLGFSWGLFLLYFDLPLVSPPQNVGFQDLSLVPLTERLFKLDTALYPFADIWRGHIEANVFLALIKTAMFGEWGWAAGIWADILYLLGGGLAVLLIVSFFSLWHYKLGKDYAFNLFCVVLTFSVLISWIGFWLEYPYFCSSEFRYVMILLPVSLLWLGNQLTQKRLPKRVNYALAGVLGLFILAKFMLYLNTI